MHLVFCKVNAFKEFLFIGSGTIHKGTKNTSYKRAGILISKQEFHIANRRPFVNISCLTEGESYFLLRNIPSSERILAV
jgi:hypothetical protein